MIEHLKILPKSVRNLDCHSTANQLSRELQRKKSNKTKLSYLKSLLNDINDRLDDVDFDEQILKERQII